MRVGSFALVNLQTPVYIYHGYQLRFRIRPSLQEPAGSNSRAVLSRFEP